MSDLAGLDFAHPERVRAQKQPVVIVVVLLWVAWLDGWLVGSCSCLFRHARATISRNKRGSLSGPASQSVGRIIRSRRKIESRRRRS